MQKLLDLPIETRRLLGIMVMRSYYDRCDCIVPIHEVERATGLKPENMIQNVEILERRRIASEIEVEDGIPNCKLYPDFESGWSYWNDIREFVKQTGTPIERISCDLDFSVFDEQILLRSLLKRIVIIGFRRYNINYGETYIKCWVISCEDRNYLVIVIGPYGNRKQPI